jgi:hypothetical protein
LVERHEGAEAAAIAARWIERQTAHAFVFRDRRPDPAGFMLVLELDRFGAEDLDLDPGARAAKRLIDSLGPLRPGEIARYQRTWMGRDSYQLASPVHSLILSIGFRHHIALPSLRYVLVALADPDYWAPFNAYLGFVRAPDFDFEVGGRRFGMLLNDLRGRRARDYILGLVHRANGSVPDPPQPGPPVVRLARPAFASAARDALRRLHDPTLSESSLVDSRLAWTQGGTDRAARVDALRRGLIAAIQDLRGSPRGDRLFRVLQRTYLEPTAVQKQAMADLALTRSTYRRELSAGVVRVVESLWRRELN